MITTESNRRCPATRHGGTLRERRYSSYSFLTSALDVTESTQYFHLRNGLQICLGSAEAKEGHKRTSPGDIWITLTHLNPM
jgi:hypothetical protein